MLGDANHQSPVANDARGARCNQGSPLVTPCPLLHAQKSITLQLSHALLCILEAKEERLEVGEVTISTRVQRAGCIPLRFVARYHILRI